MFCLNQFVCSLTDDEYARYTLAEGKRFQDSFEIIALFKRAFEAYSNLKSERTAAYCQFQMAREYFSVSEFRNAKEIFDKIANLYRQEGWLLSLWEILSYLRECSREISSVKDFIEYSLEMAALPITSNAFDPSSKGCGPAGPASLSQRAKIQKEAFGVVDGALELSLKGDNSGCKVNSDLPLYLEIDVVSPLRVVLLALVAFHEQTVKPGASSLITLSLRSRLPINIEIDQLEVQFNQSECNFIIENGQKSHTAAIPRTQSGRRVETAPALVLATNKWLRLTYEITSGTLMAQFYTITFNFYMLVIDKVRMTSLILNWPFQCHSGFAMVLMHYPLCTALCSDAVLGHYNMTKGTSFVIYDACEQNKNLKYRKSRSNKGVTLGTS